MAWGNFLSWCEKLRLNLQKDLDLKKQAWNQGDCSEKDWLTDWLTLTNWRTDGHGSNIQADMLHEVPLKIRGTFSPKSAELFFKNNLNDLKQNEYDKVRIYLLDLAHLVLYYFWLTIVIIDIINKFYTNVIAHIFTIHTRDTRCSRSRMRIYP